jgi:hypothetical protein
MKQFAAFLMITIMHVGADAPEALRLGEILDSFDAERV